MQISAVHRKRLDSKISFVFCWLEFTVSCLGCISFKVWMGKMPQIVPNLINKMFPKVVKVTKSERICIWNRRDKFDVFFFNFTIVKGIACWRYASGKENMQHSQTLVFFSVTISQSCSVSLCWSQRCPGPLQSHTNFFSQNAFNSIIISRKGAQYKEFQITRWKNTDLFKYEHIFIWTAGRLNLSIYFYLLCSSLIVCLHTLFCY